MPILPSYQPPAPPPQPGGQDQDDSPAVDLIRQKIDALFGQRPEPNSQEEASFVEHTPGNRSKHQEFMHKLTVSGKSLAEIQTAWHNYYIGLPDEEKNEIWREFYRAHERASRFSVAQMEQPKAVSQGTQNSEPPEPVARTGRPARTHSAAEVRKHIVDSVNSRQRLKPKQHLQSLAFGLGIGSITLVILLFSFFNERIIAPFISPSRHVSSTPIIIDPTSAAVSQNPEIIIPKINVEIPVDYNETSINDSVVEKALENGVLHYPTTVMPGEHGNAAYFGHSSNNIFNKGKYKFAFVLLKKLENGDVFYLTKNGKQYAYRVYDKRIVKPAETWVLGPRDKTDTVTLITCDPPGTSINRMIVTGEQISPDPNANVASKVDGANLPTPKELPSNAPSLWSRLVKWLSH
jgi:sortase A